MKHTAQIIAALAAVAIMFSSSLLAQTAKIPVEVIHAGEDSVGNRLAFSLREVIRGSNSMRLSQSENPAIVVYLVTIDTESSGRGNSTTASVTFAYDSESIPAKGYLLASRVQKCGADRVNDCAQGLAANVDTELEKLRSKWPSLWRPLNK